MNLMRIASVSLVIILLFLSCSSENENSFHDSFYEKTGEDWLTNVPALQDDTLLRNHVLLVVKATECTPCLKELAWWNTRGEDQVDAEISVLIIERYESTFDAFKESENLTLSTFHDSVASTLERELIPTTPVKLYFNGKGEISAIDHMGTGGNMELFINQITSE